MTRGHLEVPVVQPCVSGSETQRMERRRLQEPPSQFAGQALDSGTFHGGGVLMKGSPGAIRNRLPQFAPLAPSPGYHEPSISLPCPSRSPGTWRSSDGSGTSRASGRFRIDPPDSIRTIREIRVIRRSCGPSFAARTADGRDERKGRPGAVKTRSSSLTNPALARRPLLVVLLIPHRRTIHARARGMMMGLGVVETGHGTDGDRLRSEEAFTAGLQPVQ